MENKQEIEEYYTPNLEDFYLDYEYERYDISKKWYKCKCRLYDLSDLCTLKNQTDLYNKFGKEAFEEMLQKQKKDKKDFIPWSNRLRVKTLCKQDIIDLNFKGVPYKHPFLGDIEGYEKEIKTEGFNELHKYRIVKHPKSEIIEIHKIYESSWGSQNEQIFSGLCKSKNELKKLMKDYLNIPI